MDTFKVVEADDVCEDKHTDNNLNLEGCTGDCS